MPDTLVIGYGNALRGDDGAGYIAAELLRERIQNPAVEVFSLHQLAPELMEPISRARQVIFLDAAIMGRAGRYQRVPLRHSKQAFRFVALWISKAPASAVGTPSAPGHVRIDELELFPAR